MEENYAIVLDTNVFGKKAKYNFKYGIIERVMNMLNSYPNIDVFLPNIVVNELKKHIRECVEIDKKTISRYTREMLTEEFFESVIENKYNELNNFMEKNNIKVIECEKYLDIADINNWYFNQEKPFETSKPKEFPDAMIVSAVSNYFKDTKYQNVCIVSADKGFKAGIKQYLNCTVYKELKDIIKEIFGFDPLEYRNVENYLRGHNVLKSTDLVYLESANTQDVLDVSIEDYKINEIEILDFSETETLVLVNYDLKLSGDIFILDPQASFFDREEGKYISPTYKTADELEIKNVEVYLTLHKHQKGYYYEFDVAQEDIIDVTKYLDEMEYYIDE